MGRIIYNRPYVYDYQKCIIDTTTRFTITEASTKVGKTTSCYIWLHEQALTGSKGNNYWWVAPVYGQAKIAFTRLKNALPPNVYKYNNTDLSIVCPNGAIITFKSADNPDNLYGEDVYAAVFDEFTRAKEAAWFALRSTLSNTNGWCQFIGNVRGRGWGYKLAQKAKNDIKWKYNVITAYMAAEGGLITKDGRPFFEEIEAAKQDLPIDIFNELYLCIPTDTGANPFGIDSIRKCIGQMSTLPVVVYGIDLAKSYDYTCIIGLDLNGNVCYLDRFQLDWNSTKEKIRALNRGVLCVVDSTGVGDPISEDLQRLGMNVTGFKFTATSKQQLMIELRSAIHTQDMTFPEGVIVDELNVFEYSYSQTGVKYSAPSGSHDDSVCALALARHGFRNGGNGVYHIL